jgi:protein-ribulosamine 3-kinase
MLQSHYQVQFIESIVHESLGANVQLNNFHFLYCGNFNLAAMVQTSMGKFFIKWNQGDHKGMFESEAKCVNLLAETNTIRLPKVYGFGQRPEGAFLMIDFIDEKEKNHKYWENIAEQLAALHRISHSQYGLHFDNYLGAIPQSNTFTSNGIDFYIQNRLQPQVALAIANAKIDTETAKAFDKLYDKLHVLLPETQPSLLHGDLWSGNLMTGPDGQATLVDPSAYYGIREAEIAFTTLFGGFDPKFYKAYQELYPIEKGFAQRAPIYNLYPLLVHVNLFGGGYLASVQNTLKQYVF